MSKRRAGTAVGCLALLAATTAMAAPAHADPETATVTVDDAWAILADGDNERVAFVNTSREAFCTPEQVAAENAFLAWLQGGEQGDPPEFPAVLGEVPVTFEVHAIAAGTLRATALTEVPVSLWTFEDGKSWAAGNLVGPCLDTDGLVDGTTETVAAGAFQGAGTGWWGLKDNDWAGAGPRANVWGDRLTARLSGPAGELSYAVDLKNLAKSGEYLRGSSAFRLRVL